MSVNEGWVVYDYVDGQIIQHGTKGECLDLFVSHPDGLRLAVTTKERAEEIIAATPRKEE